MFRIEVSCHNPTHRVATPRSSATLTETAFDGLGITVGKTGGDSIALLGLNGGQRDRSHEFRTEIGNPSPIFYEYSGDKIGSFSRGFAALMKEAGLYYDDKGKMRDAYCLLHYYATERLLMGVSIYTLAENMGTSVGVIQQHYGHLRPEMAANELTKLTR